MFVYLNESAPKMVGLIDLAEDTVCTLYRPVVCTYIISPSVDIVYMWIVHSLESNQIIKRLWLNK